MPRNGVILMTGLPPTIGHQHLIEFASQWMRAAEPGGAVYVLLCSRGFEPIPGEARVEAIRRQFRDHGNVVVVHYREDAAPQHPGQHPDFWRVWRDIVRDHVPDCGYVFASERYGAPMAAVLDGLFVPCNVYRETMAVNATAVRADPIGRFRQIMPAMRPYFQVTATVFGAESTGKTTVSKALAADPAETCHYTPEWAREYLELLPTPEATEERMLQIVLGQSALEQSAKALTDRPFVIRDTDLLATIGFFELSGIPGIAAAEARFEPAEIYYVMPDTIPFEANPLRYGGRERESDTAFWVGLLQRHGCRYHCVESAEPTAQREEIRAHLWALHRERFAALARFERD